MGLFPKATDTYDLGLPVGPNSNVYFVDPANGDDDNKGTSPKKPMKTITAAYAACTANQHDVVAYIAGSSSISLDAKLTWAKDYTHLVGLCAPTFVSQRARIFADADNDGVTPLVDITADGCIFRDLMIFNGVDDAGCLINVEVSGARNYFENVHFAGGGHTSNAIDGGASLQMDGAEECLFRNCTFGLDTIAAADDFAAILMDNDVTRCAFEHCRFTMRAGNVGAKFIELLATDAIASYIIFDDCYFHNTSTTTTMTEAFTIPGSVQADAQIVLRGCGFTGVGDIEDNDRDIIVADMGTYTAGGNSGILANVAAT
jgi:hypothetical protein